MIGRMSSHYAHIIAAMALEQGLRPDSGVVELGRDEYDSFLLPPVKKEPYVVTDRVPYQKRSAYRDTKSTPAREKRVAKRKAQRQARRNNRK